MSAMKRLIKQAIRWVSPGAAEALQELRRNRHAKRLAERLGLPALESRWREEFGDTVVAGPFAGMRYLATSDGSVLLPKLAGVYERELHDALLQSLKLPIPRVIDIGCAEGYYAVGIAYARDNLDVVAFDTSRRARENCRALATLNCVEDRVAIRSTCDHRSLKEAVCPGAMVVCDCEGAEWELLDPQAVSALRECYLLVELHGDSHRSVANAFDGRFSSSHTIEYLEAEPRDGTEAPQLASWSDIDRATALDEMRSNSQVWVWARPRSIDAGEAPRDV